MSVGRDRKWTIWSIAAATLVVTTIIKFPAAWYVWTTNESLLDLPRTVSFGLLITLLVLMTDAVHRLQTSFVGSHLGEVPKRNARTVWLMWLAMVMLAWPNVSPHGSPFGSFILLVTFFFGVAFWKDELLPGVRVIKLSDRWQQSLYGVVLGLIAVVFVLRSLSFVPSIEGRDFYYYLCFARDALDGFDDNSASQYFYFPGVYTFWKGVMAAFGRNITSLQWAYFAVIIANAVLVAILVLRSTQSRLAAVIAGTWYLSLCMSLEGFIGVTEPLVTLPFLVGLIVWNGRCLGRETNWSTTIAFAISIGLTVYMKQPGGLLSLGALSIAISLVGPKERRPVLSHVIALPFIAALTLVGSIAFEGEGLEPLRVGLASMSTYQAKGSPWENLSFVVRTVPVVFTCGLVCLLAWVLMSLYAPTRRIAFGRTWMMVAFTSLAGVASLIQFEKRLYFHYALLAVPMFVFGGVVGGTVLVRWLNRNIDHRASWLSIVVFLVMCPFVGTYFAAGYSPPPAASLWPIGMDSRALKLPVHLREDDMADVAVLRGVLKPGDDVMIMPPRQNSLHFILGTRSVSYPLGYGWGAAGPKALELLRDTFQSPTLRAVIGYHGSDFLETEFCDHLGCDSAVHLLATHGFKHHRKLRTVSVWVRQ
jgi:hypothetical protein